MYSSGYSHVSKTSPQAQKKMQYRSKGKSCGYCMRIVFFFSSLIQSLIIVSLVLFLVYGKSQDSPSTARIHDLEESYSRLSIENVALRHQRKNLTNLLNVTLTEKARNDWDLARLRHFTNISVAVIQDMDRKQQQTNRELFLCKSGSGSNCQQQFPFQLPGSCNCGALAEQLKARLELVNSNFTQSMQRVTMEMEQITKERDNLNLEAIRLRREKTSHEKEMEFFRKRCKEEFVTSLSPIANVSKAFIQKINTLFPTNTFHLTCPKQSEHLEQIRTNCTSLSIEVEDKLQRYLNIVGGQVTDIQHENSRLKAENILLTEDYRRCTTNRTGIIKMNKQNLDKLQLKHDEEKERLLMDKLRLNGEIDVLKNTVKYKSKMVDHITEQYKQLNMSCMLKPGFGFPGGIPSQTGPQSGWPMNSGGGSNPFGGGQLGRTGSGGVGSSLGSFGLSFNKPASTGTGSSSSSILSSGSSSSFGSALNKPVTGSGSSLFSSGSSSSAGSSLNKPSTGLGSSLFSSGSSSSAGSSLNKPSTGLGSSLFSSGSSSSSGSSLNKPSTGLGSSLFSSGSSSSSGSSLNKPSTGSGSSLFSSGSSSSSGSSLNKPSTGSGSSLFSSGSSSSSGLGSSKPGSSFGSASSGSSGVGSNKPATNVKTTSSLGSSSSSSGSASKSSSGLSSWWGMGSSSSSQSKTGSSTGKGPSTGSSSGGTGSIFGGGRSSGLGGGPVSVAQHLSDLKRIMNPSGPEEKQDLSRMLG